MLICLFFALQWQPPVQIPDVVRGRPGRLIVIEATASNVVRWHAPPDLDLWTNADGKTAIVCSPKPGAYELIAWSAVNGLPTEAVRCTVVIETPEPPSQLRRRDCP